MKKCKNSLIIKTNTWNKDSNELLDYEGTELIKYSHNTRIDGYLARFSESVRFYNNKNDIGSNHSLLLTLECNNSNFYAKKTINSDIVTNINSCEMPWIVVKYFKSSSGNSYKLKIGDVIKLGRIKLKIRDMKLDNFMDESGTKHMDKKNEFETCNSKTTENQIKYKKSVCRICYCDDLEVDSPLINPCSCSGSMKYIHFFCLQTWLKQKIIIKSSLNDFCTNYTLKQIECELCKTVLPDYIKHKDKMYEIWDFTKPTFKSFMSFETLNSNNSTRTLYVINLESKNSIRIGRGHESDIRITDISVSRYHACIKRNKDGIFSIEDNNSKFGTLILLQNPRLQILMEQPLSLQIGRTYVSLTLKKPFSLFNCVCNSKKEDKKIDYQILNSKGIRFENVNLVKELSDYTMDVDKGLTEDKNNSLRLEHINEKVKNLKISFSEENKEDVLNGRNDIVNIVLTENNECEYTNNYNRMETENKDI